MSSADGGEDGAEEDRDEGEGEARGVGWKAGGGGWGGRRRSIRARRRGRRRPRPRGGKAQAGQGMAGALMKARVTTAQPRISPRSKPSLSRAETGGPDHRGRVDGARRTATFRRRTP